MVWCVSFQVVRVLECTAAVVKVGLLLFLKMVFLPLLLGLWLNAATTSIFVSTNEDRVRFAADNLVGALLLHWVAGISFMLFVTVSVLQLREVLHPEILARVIRPQEPQPDLLGSLLQESGLTHARRIAMSLAIYVFLLFLFVWLPAQAGRHAEPILSILRLRTFYIAPQLQVPIELVLFHLAMLTFLERFKDLMGQLQHWWLMATCRFLGLSRYLLPHHTMRERRVANGQGEIEEVVVVGQPMRRPPTGLDDHRAAQEQVKEIASELIDILLLLLLLLLLTTTTMATVLTGTSAVVFVGRVVGRGVLNQCPK